MKTEAGYEFQTYEVSGQELRVHWNIQKVTKEDQDVWTADEALCNVYDTRNALIEKIIGAVYSPSEEIATINNKDRKPDEYAAYQDFRALAKSLADGWIKKEK